MEGSSIPSCLKILSYGYQEVDSWPIDERKKENRLSTFPCVEEQYVRISWRAMEDKRLQSICIWPTIEYPSHYHWTLGKVSR